MAHTRYTNVGPALALPGKDGGGAHAELSASKVKQLSKSYTSNALLAGPGVCERVPLWDDSHPFEDYPLAGSAAILCTGGPDVIRKEA